MIIFLAVFILGIIGISVLFDMTLIDSLYHAALITTTTDNFLDSRIETPTQKLFVTLFVFAGTLSFFGLLLSAVIRFINDK